jgi:YVTN family beta-propeller protein
MVIKYFKVFSLCVFIFSCEKDPSALNKNLIPTQIMIGALIANEGNFGRGNASLSYYDATSHDVYNNIYETVNQKKLGDTANDICLRDTLAYIVVSISDKIEIISIKTFKHVNTIQLPPGSSPSRLAISEEGLLYVTNLYTNSVSVIDQHSNKLIKSVSVGPNPEDIIIIKDQVFVANSGFGFGNTVTVFSTINHEVLNDIKVGYNPLSFEIDHNERLHVICTGSYNNYEDPDDDIPGGIWNIDPQSHSVIDSMVLEETFFPGELKISKSYGYFIEGKKVVRYDTQALSITDSTFIVFPATSNPYHINVNEESQEVFVLDAVDYQNFGELCIYNLDGKEKYRYNVGVIPGYISFIYQEQ